MNKYGGKMSFIALPLPPSMPHLSANLSLIRTFAYEVHDLPQFCVYFKRQYQRMGEDIKKDYRAGR